MSGEVLKTGIIAYEKMSASRVKGHWVFYDKELIKKYKGLTDAELDLVILGGFSLERLRQIKNQENK